MSSYTTGKGITTLNRSWTLIFLVQHPCRLGAHFQVDVCMLVDPAVESQGRKLYTQSLTRSLAHSLAHSPSLRLIDSPVLSGQDVR